MTGWRIVRPVHAANPLSGVGAARAGSRWNSPGVRMAYASTSRSLAILEMLVRIARENIPLTAMLVPIEIPDELITELQELPNGWNEIPYTWNSQKTGDLWVTQALSPAMLVPSAVLPAERNVLINPAHPEFRQIRVGEPEPHAFDRRLFGAG